MKIEVFPNSDQANRFVLKVRSDGCRTSLKLPGRAFFDRDRRQVFAFPVLFSESKMDLDDLLKVNLELPLACENSILLTLNHLLDLDDSGYISGVTRWVVEICLPGIRDDKEKYLEAKRLVGQANTLLVKMVEETLGKMPVQSPQPTPFHNRYSWFNLGLQ